MNQEYLHDLLFCLGIAALIEGAWQAAESRFHEEAQQCEFSSSFWTEAQIALAYALLAQEKVVEATSILEAVASSSLDLPNIAQRWTKGARWTTAPLSDALSALDAALADNESIRSFCENLQAKQERAGKSSLVQWFLESAEIESGFQSTSVEFTEVGWQWRDPFGGSSFVCEAGLTIHVANGRDLWVFNGSAPRLVYPIQGDYVLQTRCEAASGDKPALGGIVLWQSLTHFLRLDWGSRGLGEISLMGCIDRQDAIIGRGRLGSAQVYLRLECRGNKVRALCSENGEEWYSVGHAEFTGAGPFEIGLYAIGNIDRLLYPGRYRTGAAIHFSDIRLWS